MVKRMTVFIFVLAIITSLSFAQNKNVVKEKIIIPSNQDQVTVSHDNYNSPALTPGTELFKTEYDYMTNSSNGPMIDLVDLDADGDLDPIMTAMQRFSTGTQRTQRFAYLAFGAPLDHFSAFDETNVTSGSDTYGWGTIQYCNGGPLDGNALLFAHSNGNAYHSVVDLVNLVPVTPFSTVNITGNYPSFVYQNDGTIIANTGNTSTGPQLSVYYASTDQGVTFDSLFRFGDGEANFDFAAATGWPAELPIFRSDDGMYLASVGTWTGAGVDTTADLIYWYGSTDGGSTWFGQIPGVGSGDFPVYGQIVNRDTTFAPYFDNFGQLNANVSNDGVTHIVINGYGEGVLPGDTTVVNVGPVLYWNSNNGEWIAVSMPETDAWTDGFDNFVSGDPEGCGTNLRTYPGNGIGQAYPNVSTSADGQLVFVAWQGYEYTGAIGSSEWNTYPGDGSAFTGKVYYTDLYYTFSLDGGATWEDAAILKGDAGVMEQFPYLARRIEFTGDQATIHYVYQEDAIPGAAIFGTQVCGQNSLSDDTRWLYDTFTFTVPGVEDGIVVNEFSLEQNYPNPFNPNTTISYSLSENSDVSLKVYDVLGNEIASLVNTAQEAGKHNVTFDAGKLASGLYIYTLKAGNFTSSKKMMLLK